MNRKRIVMYILIFLLILGVPNFTFGMLSDTAKGYINDPENFKTIASDISYFYWIQDVEENDLSDTQKSNFKQILEFASENSLIKNDSGMNNMIKNKKSELGFSTTPTTTPITGGTGGSDVLGTGMKSYLDSPKELVKNGTNIAMMVSEITNTSKEALGSENIDKYITVLENLVSNQMLKSGDYDAQLDSIQAKLNDMLNNETEEWNLTESQKERVKKVQASTGEVKETSEENQKIAGTYVEEKEKNNKIYKQPSIATGGSTKGDGTLQDMMSDGEDFISAGGEQAINAESLQGLSGRIYNILLEIGVGLSVIIGIILGIKFMLSGVEEKAEIKKMIWVYAVGCVVTFGSFGIWKLVVSILEQI